MIQVVAGIDSSTQSSTVELRRLDDGALVGSGRAPHPPTTPPVSEQNPESWWRALVAAMGQAIDSAAEPVEVVALAVGGQCHGAVLTDADGNVVRDAKLWNDTTTAAQARALVERFGIEWWADEIGVVPSAALTISKLVWLSENEPESLARAARIQVPHDYITWRLTGRNVTDRSDGSGTGYYSAAQGRWRTDILDEVIGPRDWAALLPEVLGPDDVAGGVLPEVAAELGVMPGALVGAGGGDQHLAAQGMGLTEGDVAYSLGTSGVVFATTPNSIHDRTGSVDGVANTTGGYLPLVCTLNAAKVTDAMARLLGAGHDEMAALALAAPITPDRPIMAAYLDGERSPRLPWARGMMSGIASDVSREQFALSAFEGVALGLVRGEHRLAALGVRVDGRSILVGGGARSEAYRQVIADFTGREAHTVDAAEATARGAAIQAAAVARGTTVSALTAEWLPETTSVTYPKADRSAGVYDRYERLADLQADETTF